MRYPRSDAATCTVSLRTGTGLALVRQHLCEAGFISNYSPDGQACVIATGGDFMDARERPKPDL